MATRFSLTLVILCTSALTFAGDASGPKAKKLTPSQAASHAVEIANAKRKAEYGATPFDSLSFKAEWKNGRWRWGNLDVHGSDGYSAAVSFDTFGGDDSVEVYFSTDIRSEPRRIEGMDKAIKESQSGPAK
jgi:hypothetical protein